MDSDIRVLNQGVLVAPTLGVEVAEEGALVSTQTMGSLVLSSSDSSSSESSLESTSVLLPPPLPEFFFPELLSSSSSSPPPLGGEPPVSLGLLLMTFLSAGWDRPLGLLLLLEDLLEELPVLEPFWLEESATVMILSWVSLILFFMSPPWERL